ncbi:MAG: T9SS type A sorting domain-containing protein, partial [Chitinispirillaceae bacterium]|nr:T9SS type A sorting domain-containing protein [Chitinispirillaceae bacterium]
CIRDRSYTANNTIAFAFTIPSKMFTTLKIFDAKGREVKTLVSNELDRGYYRWYWNNFKASGGVYFYQLKTNNYVTSGKFLMP